MNGQNYANHVHRPTDWLAVLAVSLVALVGLVWAALRTGSLESWALVALSLAVVMAVMLVRVCALRLQNRIIRLEMQVRLARLGREGSAGRFSVPHLVALRFASDAELPSLMERASAESLTPDQIKRAIADWQGDYLRT